MTAAVTLTKPARDFFALVQDGKVVNVVIPPADADERAGVRHDLVWAHCLTVLDITAPDGYAARALASAQIARAAAIDAYADRIGVPYDCARVVYLDLRRWAERMDPELRAEWRAIFQTTRQLPAFPSQLTDFTLAEVMGEHGEL
ncbi:hypothetical protein ACIP9H_33365 [Streptomyces sp. NPDC088732]|uniref:hypothetical protein n=1 Tax=Streptomyces sp. NPDC088732 TaxID=3365879 RepID=UPI00382E0351